MTVLPLAARLTSRQLGLEPTEPLSPPCWNVDGLNSVQGPSHRRCEFMSDGRVLCRDLTYSQFGLKSMPSSCPVSQLLGWHAGINQHTGRLFCIYSAHSISANNRAARQMVHPFLTVPRFSLPQEHASIWVAAEVRPVVCLGLG